MDKFLNMPSLSIILKKTLRILLTKTPQFLFASLLTVLIFLRFGTTAGFFGGIFFFWWFLGSSSKFIFFAAILSITSLPFNSIFKLEYWNQNLAVFGFYFFCIAIFLAAFEHYNLSKFINKYNKKFEKTLQKSVLPNFNNFQQLNFTPHFDFFQNLNKLKQKYNIIESEIESETSQKINQNNNQPKNQQNIKLNSLDNKNLVNLDLKNNQTKKILQKAAIGEIIPTNIQNSNQQTFSENDQKIDLEQNNQSNNQSNLPKFSNNLLYQNSLGDKNEFISTDLINNSSQNRSQNLNLNQNLFPFKKEKKSNLQNTPLGKIKNQHKTDSKTKDIQKLKIDIDKISFPILVLFFIVNYGLAFWVFRFESVAVFRDFIGTKVANSVFSPLSFVSYLVWFFGQITSSGINPVIFWSIFFQILFAGISTLAYFYLDKWTNYFGKIGIQSKFLCFFLGIFYAFNSWTLERFFMGQVLVIFGHVAILPCLYALFQFYNSFQIPNNLPNFEKHDFQKTRNFEILKQSGVLTICWLVLTFVSIHHGFLFGIIFVISVFCYFFANFIKPQSSFYSLRLENRWSKILWQVLCSFLVAIPSVILAFLQKDQFQVSNLIADSKSQIITSFSPQFLQNQNGFIRTIIGSGSWMSQTFEEIYQGLGANNSNQNLLNSNNNQFFQLSNNSNIQNLLGNLANWSLYFNSNLAIGFILVIFGLICLIFWYNFQISNFKSSNKTWLIFALITLIFSGVLTFGYSLGFKIINEFFYKIPFTFILRESGKFYSLFLVFLILILSWKLPKFWREIRFLIILMLCISSFSPFTVLSKSLNYVQIPEIFNFTNAKCQQNKSKKLLILPHNQYILPSWSRIFVPNPVFYFNCPKIIPNNTNIQTKNEVVPLQQSATDKQILQITTDFAQHNTSVNSNNPNVSFANPNINQFLEELDKLEINLILTDSFDIQTAKVSANLQNEIDQNNPKITKLQTEKTLTLWQIKE